jgi:hypothetical protein
VLVLLASVAVLLYNAGRRHGHDDLGSAPTRQDRVAVAVDYAIELLAERALS